MKKFFHVLCAAAAVVLLVGCSGKVKIKFPVPLLSISMIVAISAGMVILNYSGAKAQLFVKGEKEPLKFCSVKDGFVYVLQPENVSRTVAFYVSDFGNKKDVPLHEKMLTAQKAFFNAGLTFAERWANRFFRSLPKKKFKLLRKSTAEQL